MKCKESQAILVTRVNDAFCRECFMVYVTHKFRAAIGKSKLIRDGENVLVAYSGGQSSSCLLHLIKEGLSERAHKKLRFIPTLLFIDEGAVIGMSAQERFENCSEIIRLMEATGYPFNIKALEQAVDMDEELLESIRTQDSAKLSSSLAEIDMEYLQTKFQRFELRESKLVSLVNSLKSVSAKEDLLKSLRYKLMVGLAREKGLTKVMVGDCSTRLAIRLLTDISQGHGAHVAMDTSFADTRHTDLTFVRPIRDFSSKEVALYNILQNVETVCIPTLTTKAPDNSSIEHLTEKFVTGLQADYPSTTSNIMRTGEKLSTNKLQEDDFYCSMCHAPLDTDMGNSSALHSVEFSQMLSSQKNTSHCNNDAECCGKGDGSCHSKIASLNKDQVLTMLCYGCRLIVKEMDDMKKLPSHLMEEMSYRFRRKEMKTSIKDFLLSDKDTTS